MCACEFAPSQPLIIITTSTVHGSMYRDCCAYCTEAGVIVHKWKRMEIYWHWCTPKIVKCCLCLCEVHIAYIRMCLCDRQNVFTAVCCGIVRLLWHTHSVWQWQSVRMLLSLLRSTSHIHIVVHVHMSKQSNAKYSHVHNRRLIWILKLEPIIISIRGLQNIVILQSISIQCHKLYFIDK